MKLLYLVPLLIFVVLISGCISPQPKTTSFVSLEFSSTDWEGEGIKVKIYNTGSFVYETIPGISTPYVKTEGTLDENRFQELTALIEKIDLDTIKTNYKSCFTSGGFANLFSNSLSITKDETKTAKFCASDVPPELGEIIKIVESVNPNNQLKETNSSNKCSSDTECFCRIFDGSRFLEGRTQGHCDIEKGFCRECLYD